MVRPQDRAEKRERSPVNRPPGTNLRPRESSSETVPVERLGVSVYTIPTDAPEADGTLRWNRCTIVVVEVAAGDRGGLGYTYADAATGRLIADLLAGVVVGSDALAVPATWSAMVHAVRNLGRPGIASMAIAAVDAALWDLKARLLDLPLVSLLGAVREGVPVYGSGGFTSYSIQRLQEQLAGWVEAGIPRVKMKIGACPDEDVPRVRAAREAIGPDAALFVDANGAHDRKKALAFAEAFAAMGVSWFEEPVSSDDLDGLRLLRDRAPAGMDIAAGEYGYDLFYFRRMLEADAVESSRPTPRAAPASQSSSAWGPSVRHVRCRFLPTRRRRSTFIPAVRPALSATSSISTTTYASSRCCSTACRRRSMARSVPISRAPVWGWN
jgi:L-alanine-DL-glutamate epimerase-like enolase superfamily enzyme